MPISSDEIKRNFIVVDEQTTVQQVRNEFATRNAFDYIVVRLTGARFAVLRLGELVDALKKIPSPSAPILGMSLNQVPELLTNLAGDGVEQNAKSTQQAKDLARRTPAKRLVVLSQGQVVGILADEKRGGRMGDESLAWLNQLPSAGPVHPQGWTHAKPPPNATGADLDGGRTPDDAVSFEPSGAGPETLSAEDSVRSRKTPKRWINAELQDHDKSEPLKVGETYTLAFDVDTELRQTSIAGDAFTYDFARGEEQVELTVQLLSDDFTIYTEPQKLRVPRSGKSKNKARFEIEPQHEGRGVIEAFIQKAGNAIQKLTLTLQVGTPHENVLEAKVAGNPLDAAFVVKPRDLTLWIENTGTGFRVAMLGAVGAICTIPITLPELDQMVGSVRQELLNIVKFVPPNATVPVYQRAIDIPAEVNQIVLARLARVGFRLYQRLFFGPAADAQTNTVGERLRAMAQKDKLRIKIATDRFLIPWGILYMADDYDPEHVDPELFLGLKHIIEQVPFQAGVRVLDEKIASAPQLNVSVNVNTAIDKQFKVKFIENQVGYWKDLSPRGVSVTVRETADEFIKALGDAATPDQIIYFYGHASSKSLSEGGPDASTLVLSDGRLTLEDLNERAPTKKILPGAPLVFINACESAELSPMFYDGFVPYFMAKGARGVIGTECETPAYFAVEWATRFFNSFLNGNKSLGEIFLDLRREFYYQHHNVMGLLYALYCDSDTQIVPGVRLN